MIHSGTLCIQRKVTKFPCFAGLVFRAQFQHFLSAFWRSFFAMQFALVSMITITPTLSLSVFSLQRTRLFRTCGELWLYFEFEMQRRLDLWSFSWSSRRSREAQKWAYSLRSGTGRSITVPIPAGNFERALRRYFSVDFQTQYIVGKILFWSKRACFVFVNRTSNGRTAAVQTLPTHRFCD